jgi:AcrR family transcriptional regulator
MVAIMTDQLSARDWLDQGLKTLTARGFTALKAEPLAKAMGVSRGSFYWHFEDVAAFHAALLKHWREVSAEAIIADLEAVPPEDSRLRVLLRRAFSARSGLERAVRHWASFDPTARAAVQAIDRRRIGYLKDLLHAEGLDAAQAETRAQIIYWAFLGHVLSDKPLPKTEQERVLDELLHIISR